MICPECKIEFKGGEFYVSGMRGSMRRCPAGHEFKPESKRKPNDDKADAARWRWVRDHMVPSGWYFYSDKRDRRNLWQVPSLPGASPTEAVDAAMRAEDKP